MRCPSVGAGPLFTRLLRQRRAPVRALFPALLLLGPLAGAPDPVAAQDLEVVAREAGIALPSGYFARKASDPLAFELPNGLFGSRTALPPVRVPGRVLQPVHRAFEGESRFPVILALFSDSPEPWISREDVDAALFNGPAPRGTLTEFYLEASGDRFTVTGEVSEWVRTSLSRGAALGTEFGLGDDARVGEYLVEALALVDASTDFGAYDNDGPDGVPNSGDDDGIVDLVTFEFLEVSASCGGPGIWPHRWGISGWTEGEPWASDDPAPDGSPVLVDGYIIQSVADCTGSQVQTAETIAHEYGHALGLPDYYHPVGGITPDLRRWVLGCWDLMAAGAWGCGPVGSTRSAFGPTHLSAWNRHLLGWLHFTDVGPVRDAVYDLAPVRIGGQVLRIPLGDAVEGAVLLVEYRDREGFDRDVPSAGVLVSRLDPGGVRRPEEGYRYRLSIVEADGDSALWKVHGEGGDRGSAGDVFGLGVHRLNGTTHPSTATPGGESSTVTFHDIALTATGARIRLSTDPEPALSLPSEPLAGSAGLPMDRFVQVAGGTLPLDPTGSTGVPPGLLLEPDGERIRLVGVPLSEGPATLQLVVWDAAGRSASGPVEVVVGPFTMDTDRLAQALLGGPALAQGEADYLDANGNANGNLDLGDMRAWRYR